MKKVIVAICVSILVVVALVKIFANNDFVNGSGIKKTKKDQLGDFNKIDVKGNFNVILVQDDKNKIVVEGDDNIVDLVKYKIVNDGVLEVNIDEFRFDDYDLDITIHFTNLEEIKSDLVGSLSSEGSIKLEYLKLTTKSVGNTSLNLNTSVLDAKVKSVGNVKLFGNTDEFILDNSSVGKVDCRNLLANHVKLDNSSVGNTHVYADSTFNIVHSGVGNLKYYGRGTIINQKINAVGNISKGESNNDDNQ
jgi:Putative auto-transporter adhesin, head GIN domain